MPRRSRARPGFELALELTVKATLAGGRSPRSPRPGATARPARATSSSGSGCPTTCTGTGWRCAAASAGRAPADRQAGTAPGSTDSTARGGHRRGRRPRRPGPASRPAMRSVQHADHEQQRLVAGDQREVLERAADHRAEQVDGERHVRRPRVAERVAEHEVREEHRRERERGGERVAQPRRLDQQRLGRDEVARPRSRRAGATYSGTGSPEPEPAR